MPVKQEASFLSHRCAVCFTPHSGTCKLGTRLEGAGDLPSAVITLTCHSHKTAYLPPPEVFGIPG